MKKIKIGKIEINNRLVELLSVFLVIFVAILIIYPIVVNMLSNIREKAYHINEKLMITAAKHYAALNPNEINLEVGNSVSIDVNTLIDNALIDPIYSAGTDILCQGNVIIFRETESNYTYTPYLKCNGYETEK